MLPFWPSQIDYQDALTTPALCFTDPDLAVSAVLERSPFGLPLPITGQFTNVYRLAHPDGRAFAVRLFLQGRRERAQRWLLLAAHLRALPTLPACLVPFDWLEQGIYLRQSWFPLVKMPWVSGMLLNEYVEKQLYQGGVLRKLAQDWRQMMITLPPVGFVHGDLQHGNILINTESGEIRLIDYDGAYVRGLAGTESGELGHPAYQHPTRGATDYGPHMDRFPALVIYVALRALAVAPEAWYRLDNGDNLLFRREDFQDIVNSRAFSVLAEALRSFPAERRLLGVLQAACTTPASLVPSLESLRL